MTVEHGFIVIDKPSGITSHDVVAQLRKKLGTKRVGHAGTLDPMATGVLVLGINNATKFLQYITEGKKRYFATIKLGQSTSTDDREGEILSTCEIAKVSESEIRDLLAKQIGKIMQVPSKVSAIKIAGERAYDLVRQGKDIDIPAREVTIHSLNILAVRRTDFIEIDIDVECSAGTYIRAIARDLGAALGVGGHLIALRRTEVLPFSLADCSELADPIIHPLTESIAAVMPTRHVDLQEMQELSFGRSLTKSDFAGIGVAISPNGEAVAILENREYGAQPLTVFNS